MSALIALARALHFGSAMLRLAGGTLAASVASAVAWLALEAISISGLSPALALGTDTLARVLAEVRDRLWTNAACKTRAVRSDGGARYGESARTDATDDGA